MTKISVVVYGAEVVSVSCVNAPTSIDLSMASSITFKKVSSTSF